ncbi:hypothetical protein [Methylobacterium sp. AMS5]|uniref:hypothetical protein n=1 Tax=Methylobacterium sp. AMS5 TaxID=925818 RepID=UPI00074FA7C9|nr:hypothetical protein [Methylobacterium sp. AMS5]AMB47849.1 hypothetical protein Y590_23095 [Methylobacterium sp. AMS5]
MIRSFRAALVALAVAAAGMIGAPATAQTFTLAETGLQNAGACPQFAVRDRASKAMVPLGCIDAGSATWVLNAGRLVSGGLAPLDLDLAGVFNPNAVRLAPGNRVSFCPQLACVRGPYDNSINPAYFDHQRASLLVSSETNLGIEAEEQSLAVTTTIKTGFVKAYGPNKAFSTGEETTVGFAAYRAIQGGTTSANSPPPGLRPNSLPFTYTDGSVVWRWINDTAIGAKAGIYNEVMAIEKAGGIWGQANNVQLMPGMTPTFAANLELDFANKSGKDCEIGVANCFGLWMYMGGTNKSTTGIYISSSNTAANNESFTAFWAQRFAGERLASESNLEMNTTNSKSGISIGGFLPAQFTERAIFENSTAPIAMQISGNKSVGSIVDDSTAPTALNIAGAKSLAGIYEHSTTPAGITLGGTYSRAQIEGNGWNVSSGGIATTAGLNLTGYLRPPTYTINGTLPACNSAGRGAVVGVSNAGGAINYRGTIQGTGSAYALLLCDGASWIYH